MDIKRLALFLRALAWIGAALVVTRPFLGWSSPYATLTDTVFAQAMAQADPMRALLAALLLPPYLCIAWGLAQLAGFCTRLARAEHFTRAASRALARIGWSIVAAALLLPVTRLAALAMLDQAPVLKLFYAALRLPTLMSVTMGLIFGTIIVIFSALLEKSVQLQEENSSFV